MPAYTSPDNIEYPTSGDPVAPLETVFANMAGSTQDAFDGFRTDWEDFEDTRALRTYRWANATERGAQTGMQAGDIGYQADNGITYFYNGTAWLARGSYALLDKNSTALSPATGTYTQLTDTYMATTKSRGMTASGGAITIPTAGIYEVSAGVMFVANGTGQRQLLINKNSTNPATNPTLVATYAGSSAVNGSGVTSKRIEFAAGDVLRMFIYQDSGSALALASGGQVGGTFFHVAYAGDV